MTEQTENGTGGTAERVVLLTVDDDESVSRAIARDLRRQYAVTHRIVRATSGAEALEALKDLKRRGGQVAVLLADQRMPEMNGVQFLEKAMDLFPRARRVLLTAYADTEAAIDAINLADVDNYLMKPWDPPEEKLYPVIDELIEAYGREPDIALHGVKVIGHRWSPASYEMRDFLARNTVPYTWVAADEPNGQRLLTASGLTAEQLPVVITTEGTPMVAPTPAEVAAVVGLSTTPMTDFYDLLVIGAGPAGLGAAVYGASEGLRTLLVERSATGGQAGQSSRIENYLGFPDGVSGSQLTDRARRQATRLGAEILTTREAVRLDVNGPARFVEFSDGERVGAHSVIVATGVSYRDLTAPGVADLTGRGVYYGSASTEAENCEGRDVYIVGGANSAGQAAMFFARRAKSVTMLVRGESVEPTMSQYLVDQLRSQDNITIRTCCVVAEARGDGHLEALCLEDLTAGTRDVVDASHLFVFIGAEPRTDWLDGVLHRDQHGFVLSGMDLVVDNEAPARWPLERDPWPLEASVPGVFVAGDVRADSVKRVASAVGEGAMAVTLVHRYLGTP